MKPLDPRLLRHARTARGYVLLTAGLGVLTAGLVVAQAILIAAIAAPAITNSRPLSAAGPLLVALAAVMLVRALATGVQERYAHRAATRVITDLRTQVLTKAVALGPRWAAAGHGPATVTLVTRGLDDLGPYFVRYLPQLVLAATLTPATLAVVGILEWVSAVIIIVTIPLVPFFMVLIGQLTQGVADKRLATMQRLSSQVLDLVAGIPTLRAFGRERGPGARVRALGESHRKATIGTLRFAFLSGMVLELLTTLSVAVVAVGIGLRLVEGQLDLFTGLAVLIMAPEVYLPLRQVGMQFHASTDGIAAAEAAFKIIEAPLPFSAPPAECAEMGVFSADDTPEVTHSAIGVEVVGLGVRAPGRGVLAPAGLTATIAAGQITALAGPNGAGKSTTVLALLRLIAPDEGQINLITDDGARCNLADVPAEQWHAQLTWVPQRPALPPGTLWELVHTDTSPDAQAVRTTSGGSENSEPADAMQHAAALTGLADIVTDLPDGWHTRIGQGGYGLSVGQRQRVALTRALTSNRPIVILDEPTAHLDAASEEQIHAALTELRSQGRTVIVIAHRQGLLDLADSVIQIVSAPLAADEPTGSGARSKPGDQVEGARQVEAPC